MKLLCFIIILFIIFIENNYKKKSFLKKIKLNFYHIADENCIALTP